MADPLLCVRLGDIDALFHAWCQAQGLTPADALRAMVARVADGGVAAESVIPDAKRIRINAGAAHAPFLAWCAQRKTTVSAALRRMALQALLRSQVEKMDVIGLKSESGEFTLPVAAAFEGGTEGSLASESQGDTDKERVRLELRLSPSELAALTEVATAGGVSAQKLAVRLIRASLLGEGVLTGDESKHLGEINHALLRLGGNLNQIAKHLNAQPEAIGQLRHDEVRRVMGEIDAHVKTAAQMLQGRRERWRMRLRGQLTKGISRG